MQVWLTLQLPIHTKWTVIISRCRQSLICPMLPEWQTLIFFQISGSLKQRTIKSAYFIHLPGDYFSMKTRSVLQAQLLTVLFLFFHFLNKDTATNSFFHGHKHAPFLKSCFYYINHPHYNKWTIYQNRYVYFSFSAPKQLLILRYYIFSYSQTNSHLSGYHV